MATKSPVFPIQEPHHFSDYGFDPQFDYFQVLEEAKRYKQREASSSVIRSTDTFHFKLQKPISKDDSSKKKKRFATAIAAKNRRWWKTAVVFFKCRWAQSSSTKPVNPGQIARPVGPTSISGPIYITESFSGSSTPFRASSGPLTPARKGELDIPYFNLRELNAPSPMPIYLVT